MLLIDGSNLLHRALHTGAFKLTTHDGQYKTGGIYTVLNMLQAMAKQYQRQEGMVIAWDLGSSAYRRDILPTYKEGSHDMDPSGHIFGDLETVDNSYLEVYAWSRNMLHDQILPALGCVSVLIREIEADDIIATLALRGAHHEQHNIIASMDRDFLQLVSEYTSWIDPRSGKKHNQHSLIEEYNLLEHDYQRHFLYIKALVGDGDFPGVCQTMGIKGLGEVRASTIVTSILTSNGTGMLTRTKDLLEFPTMIEKLEAAISSDIGLDLFYRNIKLANLLSLPTSITAEVLGCIKTASMITGEKYTFEHEQELRNMLLTKFELTTILGNLSNIVESNEHTVDDVNRLLSKYSGEEATE